MLSAFLQTSALKNLRKDSQPSGVHDKNRIGLPRCRYLIMSLYGVIDRLYSFNYSAKGMCKFSRSIQKSDRVCLQPSIVHT